MVAEGARKRRTGFRSPEAIGAYELRMLYCLKDWPERLPIKRARPGRHRIAMFSPANADPVSPLQSEQYNSFKIIVVLKRCRRSGG
jgi:hypothetical protein